MTIPIVMTINYIAASALPFHTQMCKFGTGCYSYYRELIIIVKIIFKIIPNVSQQIYSHSDILRETPMIMVQAIDVYHVYEHWNRCWENTHNVANCEVGIVNTNDIIPRELTQVNMCLGRRKQYGKKVFYHSMIEIIMISLYIF